MSTTGHRSQPSALYWIVAAASLLWNGFGGYDYTMSKLRDGDYLASVSGGDRALAQQMLAMMDAMPLWANFLWGLGVWSSVLGSILLLVRSRHAVVAFAVSFVAAALNFIYQATLTMPPGLDTPLMKAMPLVILIVLAVQAWWARRKVADGTLR